MSSILYILEEFLKEVQKNNPYKLVIKGGTALSLFYLNHHRESESLDFDTSITNSEKYKDIEDYFINILNKLKEKDIIKDFKLGKTGLASTQRYHMKLELKTYKDFQTKIDVDFVKLPKKLEQKGELYLYTIERIFITKLLAFSDRLEFKDIYDISYLLPKINIKQFIHNQNVISLIGSIINIIEKEDMLKLYKSAFRNVDLRFKHLKEAQIENFISKIIKNLRILKNKIS